MRNIVLVPAREKSKGVRYKNLRLINANQSLLEVAFQNGKKISNDIWLSSESTLLIEYAKIIGYKIKERPIELSNDNATLDQVVKYHANDSDLDDDDILWVLQSTCPFLKQETISLIRSKLLDDNFQSVFTVAKAKGFYWSINDNGIYQREYLSRENRQSMESRLFRETGLLTATRVGYLRQKGHSRFDEYLSMPVLTDQLEACDIDTYDDLVSARRAYAFLDKQVLVVTKANSKIGSGHLYRALSIVDSSLQIQCSLACYEDKISNSILKENERDFIKLNNDIDLLRVVKENNYSAVIMDCLYVTPSLIKEIKNHTSKVVLFENSDEHCWNEADFVINALYESTIGISNIYSGYKYEIIRSDILAYKGLINDILHYPEKAYKIVVCFGGTDHNKYTSKMNDLYAILEKRIGDSVEIEISEILNLTADNGSNWHSSNPNISFKAIEHSSAIAREIAECDVLICGNGRMVYEAAALERPVIVIPQNTRECTHIFPKSLPGSVMLDHWTEVDTNNIAANVLKNLENIQTDEQKKLKNKISTEICNGSNRVWEIIESSLS